MSESGSGGELFMMGMERAAVRSEIAKGLVSGEPSVRKIIDDVKESPKIEEARKMADRLMEEEFVMHEESVQIVEDLQKKVEAAFPDWGVSLVLLGSSVGGGAETRKVFETATDDLDLGMLTDLPVGREEGGKISTFLRKELEGQEHGLHLCPADNPVEFRAVNLKSEDEALALLGENFKASKVNLYFVPSFPKEVNEQNKGMILSALTKLASTDPDQWVKVRDALVKDWEKKHHLKPKHLSSPSTEQYITEKANLGDGSVRNRVERVPIRVASESGRQMSNLYKEMLEETR